MDLDRSERAKRPRSLSSDSSSSSASASGSSPVSLSDESSFNATRHPPKFHRSTDDATALIIERKDYLCTLPPTCAQPGTSTSFATRAQLERHQEVFHRWVCRVPVRVKRSGEGAGVGRETGTRTRGANEEPADGRGGEVVHGGGVQRNPPQVQAQAQASDTRIPEAFVARGNSRGGAWQECGKVFPDERLFELHHTEVHDPVARERQARGEKIFQCLLPPPQCLSTHLTPASRRRHMIDKHRYPATYFFGVTNHGINRIAQEDGGAGVSMIRPRAVRVGVGCAGDGARVLPVAEGRAMSDQDPDSPGAGGQSSGAPSPSRATATATADEPGSGSGSMDLDELAGQLSSLVFVPRAVGAKPRRVPQNRTATGG